MKGWKHREKKTIFLIGIFLLPGVVQVAAESPETANSARWGISIGYSFTGYREETDLHLNRFLNTFTFIVNGYITRGFFFHTLNIGFFRGENDAIMAYPIDTNWGEPLEPGNQYFTYYQTDHTFTRGYGEYALGRRLWGNREFPGYLGGAFRVDVYLLETLNNYLYTSLTTIASLNLHASQEWIINANNNLVFSASFPIFGYAVRPNYIGFILPIETGFISLHNYLAIFGDLQYRYKINAVLSLSTGLGFEFSRISFPRPRRDAIFRMSAGIAFTF